jgi:outer membrane protein assembly factor BamB
LAACANWPQWGGDAAHSGFNRLASSLSAANVSSLHIAFSDALPHRADGAPVVASGIPTPTGRRDLVVALTTAGELVALDAHSGAAVWSATFGSSSCFINNGSTPCYTTSSPALDPNGKFVYAYGLDGKAHKVSLGTGQEIRDVHWPERTTRKPFDEKGSSALTVAKARSGTSYLYVTHAGYPGDHGDYQGHVTAINLSTGNQRVFNMLCSNKTVHFHELSTPDCPQKQAGVWARAGVVYDATQDRIFLSSGNGDYNPAAHDWGDSVVALNPNARAAAITGTPLDSYTPTNFAQLQQQDADLGSTAPAILQTAGTGWHLGVQSGKDAQLRLLNLADLSGHHGAGFTGGELQTLAVPQGGEVLTTPVVWTNPADGSAWTFVANDQGTSGLELTWVNGLPHLQTRWTIAHAGTTPVVVNGMLFVAADNFIGAYDAATGTLLWHDNTVGGIHWQSPVVVGGTLYIEDQSGRLLAYSS